MAKKTRKKSAGKRGKTSKVKKTKVRAAKKTKPAAKKTKKKVKRAKKAKQPSIGERVSSAYRTVVDTVKGTDQLRNKMEPPGTSESE